MAPTTWRTNTAVGVSSVKKSEAEAGISDAFARDLRIQLTGHDVAATRNDSGEQRWWGWLSALAHSNPICTRQHCRRANRFLQCTVGEYDDAPGPEELEAIAVRLAGALR
jgi:hypothetical protein